MPTTTTCASKSPVRLAGAIQVAQAAETALKVRLHACFFPNRLRPHRQPGNRTVNPTHSAQPTQTFFGGHGCFRLGMAFDQFFQRAAGSLGVFSSIWQLPMANLASGTRRWLGSELKHALVSLNGPFEVTGGVSALPARNRPKAGSHFAGNA